jgi:hypothetical protein
VYISKDMYEKTVKEWFAEDEEECDAEHDEAIL